MPAHNLSTAHHLLRYCGPQWLVFRLGYWLKQHSGWLQYCSPVSTWEAQPLKGFLQRQDLQTTDDYYQYRTEQSPPFFFRPEQCLEYAPILKQWSGEDGVLFSECEHLRQGEVCYFRHTFAPIGFPPRWHTNPFTGQHIAPDTHWSRISDFGHGDIKIIWEPSRFSFVYALVRAYWRTGDETYAELFWQLVEYWRLHNPPNQGPNWKCGQEISFRVMAWCFGLYGFGLSSQTTAPRVAALAQMIAVSAHRIEVNIGYALSQQNNHGISEAMGLWTIGTLFPEFQRAAKWAGMGREVLESLGESLIYEDGAFSPHSVNYHRLMLHDYLWCLRLGDLHDRPFSDRLKTRLATASLFLHQLQDPQSGRLPNYGHNDGALILPLNNCESRDFRPVIQSTQYLCTGSHLYPAGNWNEDLLWLFGPAALTATLNPLVPAELQAEIGGYYALRSPKSFAFVRSGTFRHRPAQADLLHTDLWWRGHNVAIDAGTYSYNASNPLAAGLQRTAVHNTVTVDDVEQMAQVSPFLWLPWIKGQVWHNRVSSDRFFAYWEGEHDGYQRLASSVRYRRGILRLGDENWLIIDRLNSAGLHSYRLHWLLQHLPYAWDQTVGHFTLCTLAGPYHLYVGSLNHTGNFSLVTSDPTTARGWHAPRYHERQPALSLSLIEQGRDLTFWTLFSPTQSVIRRANTSLEIATGQFQAVVELHDGLDALITRVGTPNGRHATLNLEDEEPLQHARAFDSSIVRLAP